MSPLRRPGVLVAFSGIDGSGKSTQAELLAETLQRMGYPTVIEWAKLGEDRWLWQFAGRVKRVLRPLHRARRGQGQQGAQPLDDQEMLTAGRELRESSRLLTGAWATVTAVSNGIKQRRRAWAHLAAGRVVLYDRFVLDSLVHLRWRYGVDNRFTLQSWLVRALSPRPARSYFLDLPADVAHARKRQDRIEDLRAHGDLYHQELARSGARRLDATRDPEDLAAEVALEVWTALNGRASLGDRLRRALRTGG